MIGFVPPAERVETVAQAQEVIEYVSRLPVIAVDTETTGLVRHKDHVVFWSMSDGQRRWCLTRNLLPYFRDFLEDPYREVVFQNAPFDMWMLLNSGVDMHRHSRRSYRVIDTAVLHALVADNQDHDLKSMAKNILGIPMRSFRETFSSSETDTGEKLRQFYESDPMRVVNYASLDAYATYKLYQHFIEVLRGMEIENSPMFQNLFEYYNGIDRPMHAVLWEMERRGTLVNIPYLEERKPVLEAEMGQIRKDLAHFAGKVINPNSNPQLLGLFYSYKNGKWLDQAGNPPIKMTDGGASGNRKPSVDEKVLEERISRYGCKVSILILKFRGLAKLHGTYMEGLEKRADSNGRIHTSFTQHVAATGRLSSRDPNLQNLPRPENDAAKIRQAFMAESGYVLGDSDQAQLEVRIGASWANERKMIEAILAGRDMHCWNAHVMFHLPYEDLKAAYDAKEAHLSLTEHQKVLCGKRTAGKTTGFGVMYGMQSTRLAADLGVSEGEAQAYLDAYFSGYPGLAKRYEQNILFGRQNGYVVTPLGRRRWIPQLQMSRIHRGVYNEGVRAANNMPIQGHAAELIKCAQIRIFEDDDMWESGVRQVLQVHDEIIGEIPNDVAADLNFKARWERYMEYPFGDDVQALAVPLRAELRYGKTWLEAK